MVNEGFLLLSGLVLGFMLVMLILGHIQEWRDSKNSDSTDQPTIPNDT